MTIAASPPKRANGEHIRKQRVKSAQKVRSPHVKPELAKHGLKGKR